MAPSLTAPSSARLPSFARTVWRHRNFIAVYLGVAYTCLFVYLGTYGFPKNSDRSIYARDDTPVEFDSDLPAWPEGYTDWDSAVTAVLNSADVTEYFQSQPNWGGFASDEGRAAALISKCYRQERTAMLLSLFLGSLGVDQWYAHHWPLAVFKMFTLGGLGFWSMVDLILWMVGGIYGTPGCGGHGWRH